MNKFACLCKNIYVWINWKEHGETMESRVREFTCHSVPFGEVCALHALVKKEQLNKVSVLPPLSEEEVFLERQIYSISSGSASKEASRLLSGFITTTLFCTVQFFSFLFHLYRATVAVPGRLSSYTCLALTSE